MFALCWGRRPVFRTERRRWSVYDPRQKEQSSVDRDCRTGQRRLAPGRCHGARGLRMTERSLQVTYRKGKPFSAYLHLSHQTGEKSARTVPSTDGLLVVDYGQNGKAIGIEITAPVAVAFGRLQRLLRGGGGAPPREHDYFPGRAA